jgi:hypothetical protein
MRFLGQPLTSDQVDAAWVRLSSYVLGPALVLFVATKFPRDMDHPEDFHLRVGLAALVGLLYMLFGTLLGWFQTMMLDKPIPHRKRLGEYLSYASFPVIFVLGLLQLSTLPLTRTGFSIGILLVLSIAIAVLCLGVLSSLARVRSAQ